MKKTKLFYLKYCPYCRRAIGYMDELMRDPKYKDVLIERIEESENKALADCYDYYLVPCFYIDEKKVFEGAMEKDDVKKVLDMLVE